MPLRLVAFVATYFFGVIYTTHALITGLALSGASALAARALITCLAVAMPLVLLFGRSLSRELRVTCHVVGGYYLAWLVWGGLLALLVDAVRLGAWFSGIAIPPGAGRTVTFSVVGVIVVATGYGAAMASILPRLRRVTIPVGGLPSHLEGLTIAHLTDLHLGYLHCDGRFGRVTRKVMTQQPDIVVFTGDQADGDPVEFTANAGPFRDVHAPLGVYAVNGNHDYYGNVQVVDRELERAGITVLGNAWIEAAPGLVLAGVEDPTNRAYGGPGTDVAQALDGVPSDAAIVLLSHQPQFFDEAAGQGVGLMLAGHTHGGQFFPWGIVTRSAHRYVSGLYRKGNSHLYVSNGVGTWGPYLRVGAPPEIPVYRLVCAPIPSADRMLRRKSRSVRGWIERTLRARGSVVGRR